MSRNVRAALALVATAATFLPLCGAIFDCGCTWPLLGADAHCNIHHPGPPDCPLCANWWLGALFGAGLWAAYAGLLSAAARLRLGVPSR